MVKSMLFILNHWCFVELFFDFWHNRVGEWGDFVGKKDKKVVLRAVGLGWYRENSCEKWEPVR